MPPAWLLICTIFNAFFIGWATAIWYMMRRDRQRQNELHEHARKAFEELLDAGNAGLDRLMEKRGFVKLDSPTPAISDEEKAQARREVEADISEQILRDEMDDKGKVH